MVVSTAKPFQIIYSLFEHEYLGYMFESFVVQLDAKGKLTFVHQNISSKNAKEFASGLDETDYELIKLMDSMQQDVVIKFFYKKKIKPAEFFLKIFDKEKGNKDLQEEINRYLERRRAKILNLLNGKELYEMNNDGEPAGNKIEILKDRSTVLFHFRRNEDNTHYFPTIQYQGVKVDFQYKGAYIVCNKPAWMILDNKLYSFKGDVDGKKLLPFINKKFIVIPKKVEETYYEKFVAQLVASFDVYAKGFEIKTEVYDPVPVLNFTELATSARTMGLFAPNGNGSPESVIEEEEGKILFELSFRYGSYYFRADQLVSTSVNLEKNGDSYIFHKIKRKLEKEKHILAFLSQIGMDLKSSKLTWRKPKAFSWIREYKSGIQECGIELIQSSKKGKRYFLGEPSIKIEVKENIDWFDIYAIVKFGDYEIPFKDLRKQILSKKQEITLPNGEVAVIPESWRSEYSELFAFMEEGKEETKRMMLKKHHLSLVKDLESGDLAKVTMSRKLEKLKEFEEIEDHPLPKTFNGELRPYQKAGYNWLQFLNQYNFGGCLADDMGLGKTVQTLAMLQAQKEEGTENASLLIMPTSLIYNWEMEAKKFTPKLKTFIYTGTNRDKNVEQFKNYDLILTSYGISRLDIDILQEYYFNYIILDESQAIKNPNSNIAKAVKKLKSRYRLILTGTPLENSTLDLWSQMTFINPGLLGNQSFFKNEFLTPIEKKHDEKKTVKLNSIIKPFILRRRKSQVAKELPEKIENIQYCTMTSMQSEYYEEAKSFYRNKILESIDSHGVKSSQLLLLQGLTKLRQIANHPKMVDLDYKGDSGKLDDVTLMLMNGISKDHKILVFSQFVKHLAIIREYLENNQITYTYLDGTTKNRQEQVDRFQNDCSVKVFLISLKAGGLGLNLTKADYVFLLDPWWNPAIEAQAVDRAHRIGQQNAVFTYKFISKNTVEEKILTLQRNKIKLANDLISTEESFVKNLSKEDIESLFD
ncbi:DEAD/DEAH box helicase [Fulvivirgaceae bacterium BMA10]|uniref:DEAD/DEAH box helicase n=1 Tax=Splendidivirga corallicola TaxID=3051826 RepID=A0ABT8KV21_9BACT|nr:DEAD/DEAH box helicase [Fulvivirgaceae bacterium BMA10]